jgi:outer membrane protein
MKKIALLAIALAAASIPSQAADLKFGVVDVQKAFGEFHKTKDAADKFKGLREQANQEISERFEVYNNRRGDLEKVVKAAQDPILTQDERGKKAAEVREMMEEVRSLEQRIAEFRDKRENQLKMEDVQMRKAIYEEILEVVRRKAEDGAYDFVFDKSGVSLTTVPVLLHHKAAVDFTDEVIVELNKDAPAEGAAPAPTGQP